MATAEGRAPAAPSAPSMGVSKALNVVAVLVAVAALAVNFAVPGPRGASGTNGTDGTDGLSCWDLNGNGVKDLATEDLDGSGAVDVADCQATAATITASTSGRSCPPCDSTTSTVFTAFPNATVALTTLRPSTFVIAFSAEMWTEASGDVLIGRAMVDGVQAPPGGPGLVGWTGLTSTNATLISVTFVLENVAAGAHSVSIEWRVWQAGMTGWADHFVLVVMAIPE